MLLQQTEKKEPTRPTNLGGTCFYASAETLSLESPEYFEQNKQVYLSNNCSEDGTWWRADLAIFSELAFFG